MGVGWDGCTFELVDEGEDEEVEEHVVGDDDEGEVEEGGGEQRLAALGGVVPAVGVELRGVGEDQSPVVLRAALEQSQQCDVEVVEVQQLVEHRALLY